MHPPQQLPEPQDIFQPGIIWPIGDALLFGVDLDQVREMVAGKTWAVDLAPSLTAAELDRLSSFKFEKRKIEWLGGRLAAKLVIWELLSRKLSEGAPPAPLLNQIEITNRVDTHAPLVHVAGAEVPGLEISITHSHSLAMAAAVMGRPIGIDLELLREPKIDFTMVFAPEEIERINNYRYPFLTRTQAIITHWTLKEAVSKHCKLGFHMDFTQLIVTSLTQAGHATLIHTPTNTQYPCHYHHNPEYILAHTRRAES